jgi:chorismate mutase
VLDPRHIEIVARHADVLQVGTRNMQNYALLAELGRAGRPVLLKRGYAATIEELLMAAEHVMANGNPDVILCERGIRTFETMTRNTLDVGAVPVLKRETHLPVWVDPSHAGGRADLVVPLAFAAVAAGADGLIVEVHPDPAYARSDGDQSLTPGAFAELMERLPAFAAALGRDVALPSYVEGNGAGDADGARPNVELPPALTRVRGAIEAIDRELIHLIGQRVLLAREAGRVKRAAGLPVVDPPQEREVLARARELARAAGLPQHETVELLERVITVSRQAQTLEAPPSSLAPLHAR